MSASGHLLRFAHLSDAHLPPDGPLPWRTLIGKRGLSVMSWRRRRAGLYRQETVDGVVADIARFAPDLIADTGDLTNFGLPQEFRKAAAWLETLPAPTVVVPGNHDAMMPSSLEEGLPMWKRWSPARAEDFPFVRREGDVAIIGVCSAIASPPFMACGRVGTGQTERLRKILEATRGLCRIVLIHHPVGPGLVPWRKSLLGWRRIARVLREAGAEMVLHGHAHCAATSTVPGTRIPLVGAPSAALRSTERDSRAGWNALTVMAEGEHWRIELTRRQMTETGAFEDAGCVCWLRPRQVIPGNLPQETLPDIAAGRERRVRYA